MITSTHTIIADALLSFIEESTGFRLKKNKFRYGCIKPDVVPKLIAIPHYFSDSFPFVMGRIEKIATLSRSKKSFRGKFSEELGVVVHLSFSFFLLSTQ
jgi:NADH:ubiquinone oxidoreductase subunit D